MKPNKIVMMDTEIGLNPTSEMLAETVMSRVGLLPRKSGSTDKMHNVMLALYEASKAAAKDKNPICFNRYSSQLQ